MIELNSNNFKSETSIDLNIVKIWASWCGPCKAYNPIFDQLIEKYKGTNVKFCQVQVDDNQDLISELNVKAVPTIVFVKNGQEVDRIVGLKTKDQIVEMVNKYL